MVSAGQSGSGPVRVVWIIGFSHVPWSGRGKGHDNPKSSGAGGAGAPWLYIALAGAGAAQEGAA